MEKSRLHLTVVLDRFEGSRAVFLVGKDGSEVLWPVSLLPVGAHEGCVLAVELTLDEENEETMVGETVRLINDLTEQV